MDSALTRVLATAPGIISSYLFGSVARGQTHRESDLDIALLLDWDKFPTAASRFEARLGLFADLSAACGRNDLDLLILNDTPPILAREIVTTGRRLYARDQEADHVFRRTVLSRAADLEPFLRRTARTKLRTLRP